MDPVTNLPITAAVIASQQTQQPTSPLPPPQKTDKRLQFFILMFVFIVGAGVGSLLLLKAQQPKPGEGGLVTPSPTPTQVLAKLTENKRWLNLSDIRQVIEEGNKLYLAVMGGVVVVDKDTGKVLDQITMADGMRNYTATSLVKKGNQLYVGTQDGFSVINLDTREVKNISEQEGLVNGANILLREDGDNIWVATFRGVAVYNTKTGKLTNYKDELPHGTNPFNASDILVTPNAVYAMAVAGPQVGVLARFDKTTQTWKPYYPADFGGMSYAFSVVKAGGKIWVSDRDRYWYTDDVNASTWTEDVELSSKIKAVISQNSTVNLVAGGEDGSLFIKDPNQLWKYTPSSHTFSPYYPEQVQMEGTNLLTQATTISHETVDHKLWFQLRDRKSLGYLDLTDRETGQVSITNRPTSFNKMLAVIDHKPIMLADGKIYRLDLPNSFKELSDLQSEFGADMLDVNVFPVTGTSNILVFYQGCGQGCGAPKFFVYDYKTGTAKKIDFEPQLYKSLQSDSLGQNFFALEFRYFDGVNTTFAAPFASKPMIATYSATTEQWTVAKSAAEKWTSDPKPVLTKCNLNLDFETNGNKFGSVNCDATYSWSQFTDNGKSHFYVYLNGKKEEMYPQLALSDYSPFGSYPGVYLVSQVSKIGDELWVGTDRGMAIYNLSENKWSLVSTKKGLTTNKIGTFVFDGGTLWNIERWSGLSGVVLK